MGPAHVIAPKKCFTFYRLAAIVTEGVKTTPQMTRFRDVQQAIIMAAV